MKKHMAPALLLLCQKVYLLLDRTCWEYPVFHVKYLLTAGPKKGKKSRMKTAQLNLIPKIKNAASFKSLKNENKIIT